jgi:hypothetical protein
MVIFGIRGLRLYGKGERSRESTTRSEHCKVNE